MTTTGRTTDGRNDDGPGRTDGRIDDVVGLCYVLWMFDLYLCLDNIYVWVPIHVDSMFVSC